VPRHVAWLFTRIVAQLVADYFAYAARLGASARRVAHRLSSTTSPTSRHRVPRHVARLVTWLVAPLVVDYFASRRLVVDYFAYAARLGVSARRVAHRSSLTTSPTPRVRVPRHVARLIVRRRLLRPRHAFGCLGTSRGSSHRSSSTTPPRAGSSSTTSPPLRIRVPRHVARLNTRLVAPLVVDYSTSRRLVVDYIAYAARLGASARRVAHRSSSTTSPTPRDRVPWHVARLIAWLVAPLVVDYFAYVARPSASARRC
jgi:hypothetical protein